MADGPEIEVKYTTKADLAGGKAIDQSIANTKDVLGKLGGITEQLKDSFAKLGEAIPGFGSVLSNLGNPIGLATAGLSAMSGALLSTLNKLDAVALASQEIHFDSWGKVMIEAATHTQLFANVLADAQNSIRDITTRLQSFQQNNQAELSAIQAKISAELALKVAIEQRRKAAGEIGGPEALANIRNLKKGGAEAADAASIETMKKNLDATSEALFEYANKWADAVLIIDEAQSKLDELKHRQDEITKADAARINEKGGIKDKIAAINEAVANFESANRITHALGQADLIALGFRSADAARARASQLSRFVEVGAPEGAARRSGEIAIATQRVGFAEGDRAAAEAELKRLTTESSNLTKQIEIQQVNLKSIRELNAQAASTRDETAELEKQLEIRKKITEEARKANQLILQGWRGENSRISELQNQARNGR